MKKILAILLALLSLVPMLAACQSGEGPAETTLPPDTDPAATEDPFEDHVPDADYKEWEFVFGVPVSGDNWGPLSYNRTEDTGDTMESAIYKRNRQIEDRFNILIDTMELGHTGSMTGKFQTYMVSNEDVIAVLCPGFYQDGKPLIVNDYVLPWNDVAYINLDKPWWNKSVSETLAICGNYYYIVGDVNWFTMSETAVCYFNKVVATEKKEVVGDLYQTVKDFDWTLETCLNISKAIANDSNGDGNYTVEDTFGAIQNTIIGVTGFVYGANIETAVMTEEGPKMQFNSKRMQQLIQWLVPYCRENNTCYTETFDYAHTSKGIPIFFDNRALFYFDILMHAETFRSYDSDFGIIPYPMFDKQQGEYVSYANQWGLACALPATTTDTTKTASIVEAMCALSRKEIVPAYYEKTLMGKVKRDDESEEMLETIFSNVLYDFGLCYCTSLGYIPAKTLVESNKKSISSWWRGNEKPITLNYDQLFKHVYEKVNGEGSYIRDFPDKTNVK